MKDVFKTMENICFAVGNAALLGIPSLIISNMYKKQFEELGNGLQELENGIRKCLEDTENEQEEETTKTES